MIKNEQKWSKMVKMIKNDQFSYLEYLFLSVPRPRGPLPWRFKPKTKKMMRPCNTLAIFNRICNGMGTEIRSDEINQAITSKTHVKPKATKSFKNVLILYHKKSLYMRIIKYCISQCLKITEKVSFNIASYGTTFTFWVDKSSLNMPNMVKLGEFLKIWILRSNSVTRQVTFNRIKIGGNAKMSKIQNATF